MQAYLIDPFAKTVTTVEYHGDFHEIYQHIGCSAFDAAAFNDAGDAVFIDDEGLLKPRDQQAYFLIDCPNHGDDICRGLAGKGLVLGVDANGDSIEPTASLDEVAAMVSFDLSGLHDMEEMGGNFFRKLS